MNEEKHQILFREYHIKSDPAGVKYEATWNENNTWLLGYLTEASKGSNGRIGRIGFEDMTLLKKYNYSIVFQRHKVVGIEFQSEADLIIFKLKFCK